MSVQLRIVEKENVEDQEIAIVSSGDVRSQAWWRLPRITDSIKVNIKDLKDGWIHVYSCFRGTPTLNISFIESGKKKNWDTGLSWGNRIYKTLSKHPGTVFTMRLLSQLPTGKTVGIGPNPVLAPVLNPYQNLPPYHGACFPQV